MRPEVTAKLKHPDYYEPLLKRFLDYVRVPTQSDETVQETPTTQSQLKFLSDMKTELGNLGATDVFQDDFGIVYGCLKETVPEAPSIGFCAHIDTVDIGLSPNVFPQVRRWEGRDIVLNERTGFLIKAEDHPELAPYVGMDVVFSDGSSVLGADDKAGAASIMTMLEVIQGEKIPHGDIYVAFFPDEEIGLRGGYHVDLNRYKPVFSYTVDGSALGEIEYETFNAANAEIRIEGVSVHPGSAKGVLVNPVLIAGELMSMFDAKDTPENSEGHEGYFWFGDISGTPSACTVSLNIRDFDKAAFERRKDYVKNAVAFLQKRHPRAKIILTLNDSYANIADFLKNDTPVRLMQRALSNLGIPVLMHPVRGGTDGSAMSARGLATPNIFTGGLNPHAPFECIPVVSLQKSMETLCELVRLLNLKP